MRLLGSPSGNAVEADSTPKALRSIGYDSNGNTIFKPDRSALTLGNQGGSLLIGSEYKVGRLIRASSDGAMRVGDSTLMLYDSVEGAAVNTNSWIQTTTTQTITQAVATGTLFNASAITTTTTGSMHTSHRRFPFIHRVPLVMRGRVRLTATATNTVTEWGFGSPASATAAAIGDGAIWRKDSTGQILPVIAIGGTEILGTPISDATFRASVATTDYCFFEIVLFDGHVQFTITKESGELVTHQDLDWTVTAASFQVTHLQAMMRTYNSGAAGAAHQLMAHGTTVMMIDAPYDKTIRTVMSGMNLNFLTSPTAFTQLAQYANSADPAAAVLSNTAASYTTLGGLFIGPTPTPVGAVTDFALFGWQNPSPYTFHFTGIKISCFNRGAVIATTATVLEWAMGFNSSAVSLATAAPYSPMKVPIGRQILPLAAAQGGPCPIDGWPTPQDVVWQPSTPVAVQPGRFLHVILRIPVGTATAAGFLRGSVAIDGFFE